MENAAILAPNTVNIFPWKWSKKRRLSFCRLTGLYYPNVKKTSSVPGLWWRKLSGQDFVSSKWRRRSMQILVSSFVLQFLFSTFCCKFAKNYCNKWNLDKKNGNLGQSNRENNQSNLCIEGSQCGNFKILQTLRFYVKSRNFHTVSLQLIFFNFIPYFSVKTSYHLKMNLRFWNSFKKIRVVVFYPKRHFLCIKKRSISEALLLWISRVELMYSFVKS